MKTSRFKDNQIIAILKQAEAGVLPFEQRGRRIANEYWMKWYLLTDSLSRQRTDGSLVRLTTPKKRGVSLINHQHDKRVLLYHVED